MAAGPKTRARRARDFVERQLELGHGDDLPALLRDAQSTGWDLPRSTFYGWVSAWQRRHARRGEVWSLARDDTGRPDLVMGVLAALIGASRGKRDTISSAEAKWAVRVANAVPAILKNGVRQGQGWELPAWGAMRLWSWALLYTEAEAADDEAALQELDAKVAVLYANEGRHFVEVASEPDDTDAIAKLVQEIRAESPTKEDRNAG